MTGLVVALIGTALCFAGVASIHGTVLLSGFGLSWMLGDALGASVGTALVLGLAGAVIAWILVMLVFKAAMFFVGLAVGAVIGAKLYAVLESGDGSWPVALIVTAAIALLCGFLADRWRLRMLIWLTALGGAGLLLHGLGRATGAFDALRHPDSEGQRILATAVWIAVAMLGWWTQRRISGRALERDRTR